MNQHFQKNNKVTGTLKLSGDKSISHRALLISSLANGRSTINNLPLSEDVNSTINCLKELGIEIELSGSSCLVTGGGFKGYQKPKRDLNPGNSGTTARLLSGILAAQDFDSVLKGDTSLSLRPMNRITEPLLSMGAKIKSNESKLPLHIAPVEKLKPINYQMPVASAQVKSAILLAGLHLEDETKIFESIQTRNHTENLLGLKVIKENNKITSSVSRKNYPEPNDYFIPGDISSAMFFIVLALLSKNSQLILKDISLNPTRIEPLKILKQMGGDIEIVKKGEWNREEYGDIIVKSSKLSNVQISKEKIPLIIDEIPILSIARIFADGELIFRGASELRVKESDRIKSMTMNLLKLGLTIEEYEDGFSVSGKIKESNATFESFGDHRIAMAFSILASVINNGGKVDNFECVNISNPDFLKQLNLIIR